MLHQLLRYEPIIRDISDFRPATICEVGSGSQGIARFIDVSLVGVDINFHDYTGSMMHHADRLSPVIADSCALPFHDGAFELVFSCDMLEHLSPGLRNAAVSEMLRVTSKKVILVFPSGRLAKSCDVFLAGICGFIGKPVPGWLSEHIEIDMPEADAVAEILKSHKTPFKMRGNAGIIAHYPVMAAESVGRLKGRMEALSALYHRDGGGSVGRALVAALLFISRFGPKYRSVIIIEKN